METKIFNHIFPNISEEFYYFSGLGFFTYFLKLLTGQTKALNIEDYAYLKF